MLDERDDAWVDVRDDFHWLDEGSAFTWVSERDGWRRAYKVSRDGETVTPLTPPEADILAVEALDEEAPSVQALPAATAVAAGAAAGMEAAIKVVGDFRGRFRGQMTARYFAVTWQPEMEPVPKDYSYLEEGGEASGEPAGDTGEADEKPAGDGTGLPTSPCCGSAVQ